MRDAETTARLADYQRQIADLREKMRQARAASPPEPIRDYVFAGEDGPVLLSALFGERRDLFLVHNMGTSCGHCTMWADGFNGIYPHIVSRAAFVVTSPDPPATQTAITAARGWRFPMVSHAGTDFAAEMGYRAANGGWLPGLSVLRRDGSAIYRVAEIGRAHV